MANDIKKYRQLLENVENNQLSKISIDELYKKFPELKSTKDVEEAIKWFREATINDIEFYFDMVPAKVFKEHANNMESTYDEFPKDAKKTDKIETLLKKGKPILPIFVELNDPMNFILEGRHRIVAFMRMGYKEIPVVYLKHTK